MAKEHRRGKLLTQGTREADPEREERRQGDENNFPGHILRE